MKHVSRCAGASFALFAALGREKGSATAPLAAGAILLGALIGIATPVQAQYIGDGQAVSAGAKALSSAVEATASSGKTVLPAPGGSPSPVGTDVWATSLTMVDDSSILNLDTDLRVHAEALTAQTNGANAAVASSSGVTNLDSQPGAGLDIGVCLLGSSTTTSLITATAVRTETYATMSGKQSRTIFTGLTIRNLAGLAVTGTDGRVYSNLNLTFEDSDSTVGVSITGVADVLLHEKVDNVDNSRTTNAIHVSLLSGPALGNFANAGVTVARSTAGLNIAAAPEPGAGALVAIGAPSVFALVRTRKRTKK